MANSKKITQDFEYIKKIIVNYLLFSLLLFAVNLILVSVVAFFHFLLDHDISLIESWINENIWEILIFSKVILAGLYLKVIDLNYKKSVYSMFRAFHYSPSLKGVAVVIFLSIFYPAVLKMFNYRLIPVSNYEFNLFSFKMLVGNFLFYMIDFLFITFFIINYQLVKKRNFYILLMILSGVFLGVSSFIIPYSKFSSFTIIHFLSVFLLFSKDFKNLGNSILYSFFCIGGFSVLYGIDLVSQDGASMYIVDQAPFFTITFLWLTASIYYLRSSKEA